MCSVPARALLVANQLYLVFHHLLVVSVYTLLAFDLCLTWSSTVNFAEHTEITRSVHGNVDALSGGFTYIRHNNSHACGQ